MPRRPRRQDPQDAIDHITEILRGPPSSTRAGLWLREKTSNGFPLTIAELHPKPKITNSDPKRSQKESDLQAGGDKPRPYGQQTTARTFFECALVPWIFDFFENPI